MFKKITLALLLCILNIKAVNDGIKFSDLPKELQLNIITNVSSLDDLKKFLGKLSITNKTFKELLSNPVNAGALIQFVASNQKKSIPFVAAYLIIDSPDWLESSIGIWLEYQNKINKKLISEQTVSSLNDMYDYFKPQGKSIIAINESQAKQIEKILFVLNAIEISIEGADQKPLAGKGFLLYGELLPRGTQAIHLKIVELLLKLGLEIQNLNIALIQAANRLELVNTDEERQILKRIVQFLLEKGAKVTRQQTLNILEKQFPGTNFTASIEIK